MIASMIPCFVNDFSSNARSSAQVGGVILVVRSYTTEIVSDNHHAGHTRKASRISKTAVENCGKGVGNF